MSLTCIPVQTYFECCWLWNNYEWNWTFSLEIDIRRTHTFFFFFSTSPEHGYCVQSGVEIHAVSMLLISVPPPSGRGSKKHSWWIDHRRTIYWWRRDPHHEKSNHPCGISRFSGNLDVSAIHCHSNSPWNRKLKKTSVFHYCFLQITRKVIRRIIIPQQEKRDDVVMERDGQREHRG